MLSFRRLGEAPTTTSDGRDDISTTLWEGDRVEVACCEILDLSFLDDLRLPLGPVEA